MVPVRGNVDTRLRTWATATATATGSAAGWLTRCSGTAARS
jgi:porphobilinogen deaminase